MSQWQFNIDKESTRWRTLQTAQLCGVVVISRTSHVTKTRSPLNEQNMLYETRQKFPYPREQRRFISPKRHGSTTQIQEVQTRG